MTTYVSLVYGPTKADPKIYVTTVDSSSLPNSPKELHKHVTFDYDSTSYNAHIISVHHRDNQKKLSFRKHEDAILSELNEMHPRADGEPECAGCRLRATRQLKASFVSSNLLSWVLGPHSQPLILLI